MVAVTSILLNYYRIILETMETDYVMTNKVGSSGQKESYLI